MLIDRTHQPWALASAGILAVAAVVYLAVVSLSDQPWSGGSAIGLTYGLGGVGLVGFGGVVAGREKFLDWWVGRAVTVRWGELWVCLVVMYLLLIVARLRVG